jgi:two-component SAPR family response regulator
MSRILVIEDDAELLGVLTALLGSEGHDVIGAPSGERALLAAAQTSFDLVIADVRMEGMSGLDAIEKVKEEDSGIKSLVITGYASEEDSIRAISLGVEAYLKKPFSLDDLLDAVNRALKDLESERAAQNQRMELTASFEWALTALSRMVEQSAGSPPLSKLSPLVKSLCNKLGVVDAVTSSAVVTSLYLGVREPMGSLVLENAPRFPRAIERALESLDEWYDGSGQPAGLVGESIPLETRIAQVAHAAVCEVPTGENSSDWLAKHHQGRYDPRLVALLKEPLGERSEGYREQLHAQRSLLSLGKAYEESGNFASARQAFSRVLEHQTNRFAMEASLGLTRLCAQEGKESPAKVKEHVERTIRMAEFVGAAPFGWCGMELAFLLHDVGFPEESQTLLERSNQAFTSLKLKVGESAVLLAHFGLTGQGEEATIAEALETVLRSPFGERLTPLIRRLLPRVLDSEGKLALAATKLVREYPRQVLECLYTRRLSPAGRLRVAEVHGKFVLPHRDAILDRLAMDDDSGVRSVVEDLKGSQAGTPAVPALRVFSLGPLSVYRGDQRVQETQWRSQKAKYLLAMLAAAGDNPVSEDKILESFWPGSLQKGRNCLYWSTSTLRQCLKADGFEMDPIVRTASGLQLNPEIPRWHDLDLFEKLADSVRKGSTNAYNIEEYLHVLDLYRGPYLEGAYYDWAVNDRHRLEVQAGELLSRFIDWTLQKQRFSNTLDYALRLLDIDPSHNDAHLAVMKAFLGLGKPKDALDHFERTEKLLRTEYDEEPTIPMLEYRQRALLAVDQLHEPTIQKP